MGLTLFIYLRGQKRGTAGKIIITEKGLHTRVQSGLGYIQLHKKKEGMGGP